MNGLTPFQKSLLERGIAVGHLAKPGVEYVSRMTKPPSLSTQARSYISTLAEHIASGSKIVSDDVRQSRRTICNGCDRRNVEKDSCTVCGCSLNKTLIGDKLGWAVSSCPLGKWGKHLEDSVASTEISSHENRAPEAGNTWLPVKFDHANLHPEIPGVRFNASIIESGDGYLYAFRTGWSGSRIYACRLTSDFKPIPNAYRQLDLPTKGIRGHEDPRFFRLNGVLHLWYIAYGGRRTSVRFCRINEQTLAVEDEFFPQIPNRNPWEKNHAYFDYQGVAYAVYSIRPHRILRIEGNHASFVAETPFKGSWSGGHLRGGASPVLHNGEWYHFFHGKWEHSRFRYSMGCYTFSPEPPFQILRYTPDPIDIADTNRKHDNYCDVLFPGGAVYRDGQWIIAHGVHDRWSEIRSYTSDFIESQLVKHVA